MKRITTFLIMFLSAGTLCAFAQTSTLIINENFQEWAPTEDTDPTDCEAGLVHEPENVRQMELTLDGATVDLDVTLIKCGIAPDCDTKRAERDDTPSTEGVTVGYVSLSKIVEETDTIGQFIFGPIHHIDSIRFGHSATGSDRGIRIYKSTDGETWERASDDEFNNSDDSQAGDVQTVVLDEYDIYIKFTSGIKRTDGTSQHSRLHNIEVWGIPGEYNSVREAGKLDNFRIYAIGDGRYQVEGDINALTVYSTAGALLYSIILNGEERVDLSNLPEGIYLVRALDKTGQIYTGKVVK